MTAVRGHVYWTDLGYGERPFLCVSNDARNARLGSFLAARVTESPKPDIPSVVRLSGSDPLAGTVLCDDLVVLHADETTKDAGPVTPATLHRVSAALKAALSL